MIHQNPLRAAPKDTTFPWVQNVDAPRDSRVSKEFRLDPRMGRIRIRRLVHPQLNRATWGRANRSFVDLAGSPAHKSNLQQETTQ